MKEDMKDGMQIERKCEIIHFGRKIVKRGRICVQRNLRVLVHKSFHVNMLAHKAIRKADTVLVFIASGFDYKSKDILLQLYGVLVCSLCNVLTVGSGITSSLWLTFTRSQIGFHCSRL